MTKTLLLAAALLLPAACGGMSSSGPYDATRDAAADVKAAVARAKAANKKVLVEVGGNWCSWCLRLDEFFKTHESLAKARDGNFIVVLVSTDGKTLPAPVSSYPPPAGFPHLYVLDADGNVVKSQDTSELEAGDSYDAAKMAMFLSSYGAAAR